MGELMIRLATAAVGCLALLSTPTVAAQPTCDFFDGIWATGSAAERTIFYLDDTGAMTQRYNVFFERWVGGQLAARMYGYIVSSMGVASEGLIIEKSYHPYIDDEMGDFSENVLTSVPMERVGSRSDLPDMLVFAGLNSALWNAGSDHVDFFAKVEDPDHVFAGPNTFEFLGCRTKPVDVVSDKPWLIVGPKNDSAGTYCSATSPGQLMFRRNAGNDGLGIAALNLHLVLKSNGGAARSLMEVDDTYTAWTEASVVEAPPPDGIGSDVRNVFTWSYDGHFRDALMKGKRLRMKVGSDVTFDPEPHNQPGRLLTYALDGSSKAIAALDECISRATQ